MTIVSSRVSALFKVEPGEERPVALLTGLNFFLALAFIFIQAITFGLFIAEFGARSLPIAYITIAVLASLVAFLYLKLSGHLSFRRLLVANLTFISLVSLVYWFGLRSPASRTFTFFLPFWFQTMINLVNLALWPLAGRILELRQAKRLFGLIGSGYWLAAVIGGLFVAPLVTLVGPPNLMLLAVVASLVGLLVLFWINRLDFASPPTASPSGAGPVPASSPFKDTYIRLIFAYTLLWWVAFYFVDNIFYDRAFLQIPDAGLLAGFVGRLLSVIGLVALVTSTFLTGRIITRYGLRIALILMPAIVMLMLAAVAITGTLSPGSELLFWLAVGAKLVNVSLGFSLSFSASTLLYQPLPVEQRGRAQTLAEGIVQPFAIGLAGVLLLLLSTILGMKAVQLAYVFLVVGAALILVILRLHRQYPLVLARALTRRRLSETPPDWSDPASLQVLQNSLESRHPADVVFALNRLEALDAAAYRSAFRQAFPRLLAYPTPEIRREVLERAAGLGLTEVAPEISQALPIERDVSVRAAALQALLSIAGDAAFDQVAAALHDPHLRIRRAALVALMQHGGVDGILSAGDAFNRLVHSTDPRERLQAAEIVAEVGVSHFYASVLQLIQDDHPEVRRAAVKAAGVIRSPRLWPAVVAACAFPETSRAARHALRRGGPAALPAITAAIDEALSADRESCHQLITLAHALGQIGGDEAVELLHKLRTHPENSVRSAALEALSGCGARLPASGESLNSQLQLEIRQAARQTAVLHLLGGDASEDPLCIALERALGDARDRVLWLLSLVYEPGPILQARFALSDRRSFQTLSSKKDHALELVDTLLPASLKGLVLPLLEPLAPGARLQRWRSAGVSVDPPGKEAALIELIFDPALSAWIRSCGLYALGRSRHPVAAAISRLTGSCDPVLSGTARWYLRQCGVLPMEGGSNMLLSIEKVLILKKVSIFDQVTDEVLAGLAQRLEELEVAGNTPVFAKGEPGDSMYMIVDGEVRIHDGERELQTLGEGDFFGEMALLDPELRSASATTTRPTRLLRLAQAPLFELLDEEPEVAAGIIRVLTRRLRERLRDISELDARLKALPAVQPA